MVEMGCINDGEMSIGELSTFFFYSLFGVEANAGETQQTMDMDKERKRMRK